MRYRDTSTGNAYSAILDLLRWCGEDPDRPGLKETPERVAKAWLEWTKGYDVSEEQVANIFKVFEDGAENYDEMIIVKDIPFYSHCEHHLAPFFGTVTIGYVPAKKIIGLSKLSRLTDVYARRLQVQERMTVQIAEAIMKHLGAKGAGVIARARHLCMESRGIKKQGSETLTSALRGVFQDGVVRTEFLSLRDGK